MLPYGRTWNCRIARLEGEKLEEAELLDEGRRATNGRNRDELAEERAREKACVCKRERERETERKTEYERALRGVCVAWVETAPRSPTGRIIIPIHARTQRYTHTHIHT